MTSPFKLPPLEKNYKGNARHIGIEIEFGSVSAIDAAKHVQKLFGGELVKVGEHRVEINATELGDFLTELDFEYVHRPIDDTDNKTLQTLQQMMQEFIGTASSMIVPCEIVCPPIEFKDINRIESLIRCLSEAGASGTSDNLLYGFGFQLNPEIASDKAEYITRVLKAHLLLSDWLRAVIKLDITRQVIAFADPFPKEYVDKVVHPDYWPDLDQLIEDYLIFNATRNREFDMLPLFSWLNEELVGRYIQDERIKQRPTFHYRLPNADINQPDWSLKQEWHRWCVVERLSEEREKLQEMGKVYIENSNKFLADNWAIKSSEWLVT